VVGMLFADIGAPRIVVAVAIPYSAFAWIAGAARAAHVVAKAQPQPQPKHPEGTCCKEQERKREKKRRRDEETKRRSKGKKKKPV
jgi:hypothetical protein